MSEGKPKQQVEVPQEDDSFVKLAESGWDAVVADAPRSNVPEQMNGQKAEAAPATDAAELEAVKARLERNVSASEAPANEIETPVQSTERGSGVEKASADRETEAAMDYLGVSDPNDIRQIEDQIADTQRKNSDTRSKILWSSVGTAGAAFFAGASSFPLGFGTAAATTIGIETGAAIGLTVGAVLISGAGVALAAGAVGWAGKYGYDKLREWRAVKQSEKYVAKTRGKGQEVRYDRLNRRFEVV